MKSVRPKKLWMLLALLMLIMVTPLLTAAAPLPLEGAQLDPDPDFWAVVAQFVTLGGFAALAAIVINVFKAIGLVKDDTAGTWAAGINLAGLIALYVAKIVSPELNIAGVDAHLSQLAEILTLIFAYIMQNWVSRGTHEVLASGKVPLIGTSYSRAEPF